MKTYSAAVIGLGNIGMNYDYDLDHQQQILTHCSAFHAHPGFDLVAAIDIDESKRALFEKKYQKPAFSSVKELCSYVNPEVVSFCLPCQTQPYTFFEVMHCYKPLAVICEKPLADQFDDVVKMVSYLKDNKITSIVNFIRRFEPGVMSMLEHLKEGQIGKIQKIVAWYSKDIFSNGIHILDLINYLFNALYGNSTLESVHLFDKEDRRLVINGIPIYFLKADSNYNRFEIHINGEDGVVSYLDSGRKIIINKTKRDTTLAKQKMLDDKPSIIQNDIMRYQWYVQEALYQALSKNQSIASTAQTALQTHQLIKNIEKLSIGEYCAY